MKCKPLRSEQVYLIALHWGVTMNFTYRGDLSKVDESLRAKIMQALTAQQS